MGQIGQPVRRYTVVPLEEPVSPTAEPLMPASAQQSARQPCARHQTGTGTGEIAGRRGSPS
jgi:hypothetical protein